MWEYDLPSAASAVSWAVIVNNVAALEILMDCGYLRAGFLVCVAAACRAGVGWVLLGMVGLRSKERWGVDLGIGGVVDMWEWVRGVQG